jgi:hypothetical protein
MPYPWMASVFLRFLRVFFLLLPFVKLHHSLYCRSVLLLTFFSSTTFQIYLWPSLNFLLGSMFLIHKEQHTKYNFL